jgi:hypothetical protein
MFRSKPIGLYSRLFPKTSDSRFVADQCIGVCASIIGWVLGLVSIIVAILGISYTCGHIAIYIGFIDTSHLNNEFIIGMGFVIAFFLAIAIAIISALTCGLYHDDYKPWVRDQQKIITMEFDEEAQINAPVNFGFMCTSVLCLFPFGSVRRYIARTLIWAVCICMGIVLYAMLSIALYRGITGDPKRCWSGRNECKEPYETHWFGALSMSFAAQLITGLSILGLYFGCGLYCETAWKRHRIEKADAIGHKGT